MQITMGRTVHYRLSEADVVAITRRRTNGSDIAQRLGTEPPLWPYGAQAHIGNTPSVGDVVPMVVVRVWTETTVNGQALLDGNDVLWVTSATEGSDPGQWVWPAREPVAPTVDRPSTE